MGKTKLDLFMLFWITANVVASMNIDLTNAGSNPSTSGRENPVYMGENHLHTQERYQPRIKTLADGCERTCLLVRIETSKPTQLGKQKSQLDPMGLN